MKKLKKQTLLHVLRKSYISLTFVLGVVAELGIFLFLIYFILGAVE